MCAACQSSFSHHVCQQHPSLASAFYPVSTCFELFFVMDVSSETSILCAPEMRLCSSLLTLQCGLPREDWDNHPLYVFWALDDSPCHGLFACPVCAQWPEDKRQRFLATQTITAGQRSTLLLSPPPPEPELTIIFISTVCRFGPRCLLPLFQTTHTPAVRGVSRPATLSTRHL